MNKKIKKITGILISACIVLTGFSINMAKVEAASNLFDVIVNVKYGQTEARTMLEMINSFRLGSEAWYWNSDNTTKTICTNLNALSYDYELEKIAMQRAAEIALSFAHERTDGTRCFTAYSENEYVYMSAGENIAAGYRTASEVFNGWREDSDNYSGQGHRRNMLGSDFNVVGIGHAYYNGYHYWVQEFATVKSVSVNPTIANDTATDVNIKISADKVYDVNVSDALTAINLKCGETKELSGCSASFYVTNSFPTKPRTGIVYPQITSTENTVAEFEGNKIKALTAGNITIKANYLGIDKECSINVSHEYTDKIVESTCTTKGYTEHECKACGYKFNDNYTPVSDHKYITKEIIKDATYTQTGLKTVVCTLCGGTKEVVLPVLIDNGWREIDGQSYWYEDGVLQGYSETDPSYRGKEIYDPESDAWYWLDSVQNGAKAVNKDVYQESEAGIWGDILNADGTKSGKWVRYDADGHMVKGWSNDASGNKYYFDETYGTMAKGYCTIGEIEYYFNSTDGRLERIVAENIEGYSGWKNVEGKDIWYENGIRQGYSVNSSYRGKEIYDKDSDAWYWLDNVQSGAKAVSKDVYQESEAGIWGDILNADGTRSGKWVRYDENGHMIKGWSENSNGRYYFDPVYGTMAKGNVKIGQLDYSFDKDTGILYY